MRQRAGKRGREQATCTIVATDTLHSRVNTAHVRVPIGDTRRSFEITKTDARARLPVLIMTRLESTLVPSPVPPPQPCCTLILTTGFLLSTVTLFASTVFTETEKAEERGRAPRCHEAGGRKGQQRSTAYPELPVRRATPSRYFSSHESNCSSYKEPLRLDCS